MESMARRHARAEKNQLNAAVEGRCSPLRWTRGNDRPVDPPISAVPVVTAVSSLDDVLDVAPGTFP